MEIVMTKLPSYLKLLLQDDAEIQLIYKQGKKTRNPSATLLENSAVNEKSNLDLTGTPLETDLGHDDTIVSEIAPSLNSWSEEEGNQCSVPLTEVRKAINNNINSKKQLVGLCDGSNSGKTVIMGASMVSNQFTRIIVSVLPCCQENNDITSVPYLKKEHLKCVRKPAEISVNSLKKYNLFGLNLRNCNNLENVEFYGNIAIEMTEVDEKPLDFTMNLQVIAGHSNSPLHFFWLELSHIQKLIKQARSINNNLTENETNSTSDVDHFFQSIYDLINTIDFFKQHIEWDLNNLRHLNLLDRLWDILKFFGSIDDLRNCFHLFFEELAEVTNRVYDVEDSFTFAKIVDGILKGKLSVPTLSNSQSVEFLIELGLEKVKNDYFEIIRKFCPTADKTLTEKWKEISANSALLPDLARVSRFSINPKSVITNMKTHKMKLSYLHSLHQLCEFIFLCKEKLPIIDERFQHYCELFYEQFIEKVPEISETNIQLKLCQISLKITSQDATGFIQKKVPHLFTVKLYSALELFQVETVYNFSDFPIFPPSIFDKYEFEDNDSDIKHLFVTKLVKYIDTC